MTISKNNSFSIIAVFALLLGALVPLSVANEGATERIFLRGVGSHDNRQQHGSQKPQQKPYDDADLHQNCLLLGNDTNTWSAVYVQVNHVDSAWTTTNIKWCVERNGSNTFAKIIDYNNFRLVLVGNGEVNTINCSSRTIVSNQKCTVIGKSGEYGLWKC